MSQIKDPDPFIPDRRDWNAWRDRTISVEKQNYELRRELSELRGMVLNCQRQMALFMSGSKERFDAISLLLARLESTVDRKDV
jgi:hypothetical protein